MLVRSREVPWKLTHLNSLIRPSRWAKSTMASWQVASGCAQAGDLRKSMPSESNAPSQSESHLPDASMTHTDTCFASSACFRLYQNALSTLKAWGPAPTMHASYGSVMVWEAGVRVSSADGALRGSLFRSEKWVPQRYSKIRLSLCLPLRPSSVAPCLLHHGTRNRTRIGIWRTLNLDANRNLEITTCRRHVAERDLAVA